MTDKSSSPSATSREVAYIDPLNPGIVRFHGGDAFDGVIAGTRAQMIVDAVNAFARSETGEREDVKRLLEVMDCDSVDEAISIAEFDNRQSIEAALAIKLAGDMPENAWPSAHERRFFIALREQILASAPSAIGQKWRDPKDKPPHLSNEYHSQDVLLCMKARGWVDDHPIKIGHVSCGHWRPAGSNGNFDDDVLGWMPLPEVPSE